MNNLDWLFTIGTRHADVFSAEVNLSTYAACISGINIVLLFNLVCVFISKVVSPYAHKAA